jgi:polysaccharide export outer membrane protein
VNQVVTGPFRLSAGSAKFPFRCLTAALVLYAIATAHAQILGTPSTPQTAPQGQAAQVITVQVPADEQRSNNGPNWNRTNGTQSRDGQNPDAEERYRRQNTVNIDPPTEFQMLVAQTVGATMPIFGSDLFSNAPSTFAPVASGQVTPDYVIGAGDEILISATGQLNEQGTFTVDRAGHISIPEVGTLTVSGLKFSELQPFLRQQIGRVYRNFNLSVTLGQLRSIQVYILGETRRPGSYTVSSLSTLVNALFVSGGIRPQGSLRHIELRRGGNTVTTVDLYDLLLHGDKTKDAPLQPGDIIFVPTVGPQVAVVGSVTNPAIYELNGETTLGQLLQLASGLTSTATGTGARIESVYDHVQRTIVDVNLASSGDRMLHAGDIVTVAAISDRYKDAVTLRGNVANPGRYLWHVGMHLSDLIPDRESLITRNYYRQRNLLGQAAPPFPTQSGPLPQGQYNAGQQQQFNSGQQGQYSSNLIQQGNGAIQQQPNPGHIAVSTTPSAGVAGSANEAPTPTATNTSNANGGGTTVGDALTQGNGTFAATNDVVLSAPDVDLAYAVIERLDPVSLTTSLIPFNLQAVIADHGDTTQNLALEAGDVVTIFSKADIRVPQSQQTRFVRLEGEFVSAGVYSVKPGETLRQLIARSGGLTPDAYLYASEFTRQSTRRVEQQRLREYADSLDTQINTQMSSQIAGATDPSSAAQTANASAQSARAAVARIRTMQATGRIVLKLSPTASGLDAVPDLSLEDGDRFIVPRQPTSVAVAGQVYNASSFLFAPGLQVRNYVRDAGGPDRNADSKRLYVIRADGSVVSKQYDDVLKAQILPGDTVVVPPQLTHRNILRDIVTIATAIGAIAGPFALIAALR